MLACSKCNKELEFCSCKDIDDRIRSAKNDPNFVFKMCIKCDRHYARCRCITPKWKASWDNVSLESLSTLLKEMEKIN